MKHILKGSQPESLTSYQATPNANYDGMHSDVKQEIRDSLVKEQGLICAYCMRTIAADYKKMEIEHFQSQTTYPDLDLKYFNMLATCNYGGRSCSEIKDESDLLVLNPLNVSCESLLKFKKNGEAVSENKDALKDIEILKLNKLSDQRKVVIDKARERLKRESKNWTNEEINREVSYWKSLKKTKNGYSYEQFCMAAVHYLQSKIK